MEQKLREELYQTNQKLYVAMRAFQMAAEESRSLVFTYDLKRQTIFVDEQTARTFGVAEVQPDVPYGMVGRGIVSEDTVDEYIRIHEEILNGGLQAEGIVKLITVDGTLSVQKLKFEMIMDAEGKPSGTAVGIYRDITGQYQDEKELRRYQRLDYVIQAMKNDYLGIFELDLVKERYCVLHCGREHSFPLPMEGDYKELVDKVAEKLIAPEFLELSRQFTSLDRMRRLLAVEERAELEYMTTEPGNPWRRSAIRCVKRVDGIPVQAVVFQMDIDQAKSERLRNQLALQEAYRYAESANRAKLDFMSTMSHDMRTPLNAVMGMTSIARTRLNEPERLAQCLDSIDGAARHLLDLVNEVLDMNKLEAGAARLCEARFSLREAVDSVHSLLAPLAKEHGHCFFVSCFEVNHVWVLGDRSRFEQILVNLLSNSIKYTPDGGTITLSVRETASNSANYGVYEICAEDNGIGMSREFKEVMFEPFTRAEDSRFCKVTGTGLGMSITRSLVYMMDGEIQVHSEPGQGTCITVSLHLKAAKQDDTGMGDGNSNGEGGKELPDLTGIRILLAEDNDLNAEIAKELLEHLGAEVKRAANGREAVQMFEASAQGYYDLIFMDIQMPKMNGYEAVRQIRRLERTDAGRVPVIAMTANAFAEDVKAALGAGMNGHLAKPADLHRMAEAAVSSVQRGTADAS